MGWRGQRGAVSASAAAQRRQVGGSGGQQAKAGVVSQPALESRGPHSRSARPRAWARPRRATAGVRADVPASQQLLPAGRICLRHPPSRVLLLLACSCVSPVDCPRCAATEGPQRGHPRSLPELPVPQPAMEGPHTPPAGFRVSLAAATVAATLALYGAVRQRSWAAVSPTGLFEEGSPTPSRHQWPEAPALARTAAYGGVVRYALPGTLKKVAPLAPDDDLATGRAGTLHIFVKAMRWRVRWARRSHAAAATTAADDDAIAATNR